MKYLIIQSYLDLKWQHSISKNVFLKELKQYIIQIINYLKLKTI
jgi:hypothetical protein